MQVYLNLIQTDFVIGLKEEALIYNLPHNNSKILVKIREYHYLILLMSYVLYTVSIYMVIDFPKLALLSAFFSAIGVLLYTVYFFVYTTNYLKLTFYIVKSKGFVSFARSFSSIAVMKKVGVVCLECVKFSGNALIVGVENESWWS
jgi:hypothetical protein